MGFENRDYAREEHPWEAYERRYQSGGGGRGGRGFGGLSITVKIIIACFVMLAIDFFTGAGHTKEEGLKPFFAAMSLSSNVFQEPWQLWTLLTHGFAHDSFNLWHIIGNMFMLFIFGRAVEEKLGAKEYLTFYIVGILFAGLVWVIVNMIQGVPARCVGASGTVTAVFVLFVLYYPRRTLWIWGIIETPAWLLGIIIVGMDLVRAFIGGDSVAHDAHLAGAAFAFLYFRFGWRLSSFLPGSFSLPKRQPKLKIHTPETGGQDEVDNKYQKEDEQADRILEKIHIEGEESLTRKERKILEDYSRRMKQKRQ